MDLNRLGEMAKEFRGGMWQHYLLLHSIVFGMEAKRVFEFGHGESTEAILSVLPPDGTLTTCALQDPLPLEHPGWTYLQGDSRTVFDGFTHPMYDVVLHDGSHTGKVVGQDLRRILPYVRKYGIVLVHDTQHAQLGPEMRRGVKEGIAGRKCTMTTLPYGYGLTIIRMEDGKDPIQVTAKKVGHKYGTQPA
jgi:predicted O-methyltransferase YrrM